MEDGRDEEPARTDQFGSERAMEPGAATVTETRTVVPEDILGPLNEFELKAAPRQLFLRGDDSLLEGGPRIAVVGSRRASPDGLELARRITEMLVSHGVTVVSGLALGIDTVAHETTITNGGRTVGVLGTSLDRYAVSRNRGLQDAIGERHLLVSQFPCGQPPHRSNFPLRNNTMALLSDATLIVEATTNSGTRHQGWEAIRLGRPVLFPKRSLARQSPDWADEMIRYGAFSFDAGTLPLVLDDLPSRCVGSASRADDLPF